MVIWREQAKSFAFSKFQVVRTGSASLVAFFALQRRLEDLFYGFQFAALEMDGCAIYHKNIARSMVKDVMKFHLVW